MRAVKYGVVFKDFLTDAPVVGFGELVACLDGCLAGGSIQRAVEDLPGAAGISLGELAGKIGEDVRNVRIFHAARFGTDQKRIRAEFFKIKADGSEIRGVGAHGVKFLGRERDRNRFEQVLGVVAVGGVLDALINDAFVGGVLVDEVHAVAALDNEIGVEHLTDVLCLGKLMLMYKLGLLKDFVLLYRRTHRLGKQRGLLGADELF